MRTESERACTQTFIDSQITQQHTFNTSPFVLLADVGDSGLLNTGLLPCFSSEPERNAQEAKFMMR